MLTLLWTDRYTVGNVNAVVGETDTQWGMLTLLWTDRYTVGNVNAVVDRYTVGNVNTVVDRQIHSGEC